MLHRRWTLTIRFLLLSASVLGCFLVRPPTLQQLRRTYPVMQGNYEKLP